MLIDKAVHAWGASLQPEAFRPSQSHESLTRIPDRGYLFIFDMWLMILTTKKSFISIISIRAKHVEPSTITCSGDWIPSLILKVLLDKKISSLTLHFWIIDHHRRNIILKFFKPEGASSSRSRNIQSSSNAKVRVESKNEHSHDQKEREYSYRINFSELQHLKLRKLQINSFSMQSI